MSGVGRVRSGERGILKRKRKNVGINFPHLLESFHILAQATDLYPIGKIQDKHEYNGSVDANGSAVKPLPLEPNAPKTFRINK